MRGAGAVNVRAAELAGVAGALARAEMAGIQAGGMAADASRLRRGRRGRWGGRLGSQGLLGRRYGNDPSVRVRRGRTPLARVAGAAGQSTVLEQ